MSAASSGLEVEPQQRLGVRAAHVEVPVVVVDGDAVELGDAAVPVALLEPGEGARHVVHLRVDLARDVVALAQRGQDLAEPPPARARAARAPAGPGSCRCPRTSCRGSRSGPRPRRRRRAFSSRMRFLMKAWPTRFIRARAARGAHAVGAPRARRARRRRCARPGSLAGEGLAEQRGHEVAGHERARVVDEEAAVGVAVPGDAEVGPLRHARAPRCRGGSPPPAGRRGGWGRCRRARSTSGRSRAAGGEDRRGAHGAHAVAGVEHDLEPRDRGGVDEGQAVVGRSRRSMARRSGAGPWRGGSSAKRPASDRLLDLLDARRRRRGRGRPGAPS